MTTKQESSGLNINRLETLIDGVFAIAMTILVLAIDIPENSNNLKGIGLHEAILDQSSQIIAYVIGFILLALFWTINHKQFASFIKTDHNHVWINIFMLIFICLVPYTTSLKGNYPNDWLSNLYFNINMLIISSLFLLNWLYATYHNRLTKKDFNKNQRITGRNRNLIFVFIAIIAVATSYFLKDNSAYCYLLVPVLKHLKGRIKKPGLKKPGSPQ